MLRVNVTSGEYAGKQDVIYNIETGETICFSDLFKTAMTASGLSFNVYSLRNYNSELKKAIFDTQIYGNSGEFQLFDIENNSIREIPIPDGQVMGLLVSYDFKYCYYHGSSADVIGDYIYQVDLTTFETKRISEINRVQHYMGMGDSLKKLANGKTVYVKVANENDEFASGADARWFIYNIENQTSYVLKGDIIRFTDSETIVIVESTDGIKYFDVASGNEFNITDMMNDGDEYRVDIQYKQISSQRSCQIISLKPYLDDSKEDIVVSDNVNVYHIDGDYLYTYTNDTDYVNVFCLKNFESFNIKLSENFINTINNDKKSKNLYFYFTINESKTRLLLFYEASELTNDSDLPILFYLGENFSQADCLEDFLSQINKYDDSYPKNCTMYKGDGFNSLIISDGWTFAVVEDYRDKTFTLYSIGINEVMSYADHYIYGELDICTYNDTKPNYERYRRKLDSNATNENTLMLFDFISTKSAFIDYADFYNGDKLNNDKIFKYANSPDNILKHIKVGYVTDLKNQKDDGVIIGYDILDNDVFGELLDIANNQTFLYFSQNQKFKLFKDHPSFSETSYYNICCSFYIESHDKYTSYYYFDVGISTEGKKYVKHNGKYAYIDDVTFNKLCDLCDQMWHDYTDIYGT
ncbi:MAG TPA: hypothetical protein DCP51_09460 [Clostridiales bacterium]|nr:hypothetical protein [Clostridiales bacterium]